MYGTCQPTFRCLVAKLALRAGVNNWYLPILHSITINCLFLCFNLAAIGILTVDLQSMLLILAI